MELLYDFNATRPSQMTQRNEIARQLLGEFGEDAYIEPPLHANWGCNTYFSAHAYANFNLTLVDDGEVHNGEHDDVYYWRDRMINPPYDQKQ